MLLKPFSVLFLTFISISFAKISNSKYYLYEVTPENENASNIRYEPTWRSIDSRPLPSWYDKAKIGIFIHWGVFSVPSFGAGKDHSAGEWFWAYWKGNNQQQVEFMEKNYPPNFKYQEFASDFKAELYDPDQWADLFVKSGAKYVVLTSKHHDGYTLWPSQYSYSWNAKDVGPGRDVLGELAEAVRSKGLTFGLYHSLLEWYNPMYLSDKASNWQNSTFVDTKVIPEMKELVEAYRPSVLWSDGDWEASDSYWKATEFLAWLYNESPIKDEVVVNDRWGIDIPCAHGGFYTCSDRYNPGTLQPHKWENAMTIDWSSWGFRRNAVLSDYMSIFNLIEELTQTVSCGGNILINIGPTAYGTIAPIYEERLTQLGEWLAINGEAIYESTPWSVQNDTLATGVWYTSKGNAVYAISLHWPEGNVLELGSVNELVGSVTNLVLLGNEDLILNVNRGTDSVSITFPDKSVVRSETAYVLKFT